MSRRRLPAPATHTPGPGGPPWRVRARIVLRLAAVVAVLLLTAADALLSAAAGTRPLTLRVRSWIRALATAYERARHPDVIDAEVIEEEEVRR